MTETESLLSIEYIRECFYHVDGVLYWKERPREHFKSNRVHTWFNNRYANARAGVKSQKGHHQICLEVAGRRRLLMVHRVIWALHTGRWPEQVIDHINRQRDDNRMSNLRDISPDANLRNNGNPRGTGLLGAYRLPTGHIYSQLRNPYRFLGMFATPEAAHRAYLAAKAERDRETALKVAA